MRVREFPVGRFGTFLATRSDARKARTSLEALLDAGDIDYLIIDFTAVEAMTISFADELIGRFFAARSADDNSGLGIQITGLNEETHEALDICLERRELIAPAEYEGHQVLLGAPGFLTETYAKALTLHRFRASELATALGISASNANNRLKRLAAAGALRRERVAVPERGGKEFGYTVAAEAA